MISLTPSATHASDGAIVRFIDGQLLDDEQEVPGHIAACARCSNRAAGLRTLSDSFGALLSPTGARPLRIVAGHPEPGARGAGDEGSAARRLPAPMAAAITALAIGLAVGVASAMPLRQWIGRVLGQSASTRAETGVTPAQPPQPAAPSAAGPPAAAVAGIRVPLVGGEALVAVEAPLGAIRVRVRLVDSASVAVRGVGEAARAEFEPRGTGIAVTGATAGEIQVDVPRSARRFELRIGGRSYLLKDGARLRVLAPEVDTVDTDLLFSVRPR